MRMRLSNLAGRAVLLLDDNRGVDVFELGRGAYGPSLPSVYENWRSFTEWATSALTRNPGTARDRANASGPPATMPVSAQLPEPPSPAPRQNFAIGRNYHTEPGLVGTPAPDWLPPTFTKFASSLAGPQCDVRLPAEGATDWEAELVVVIGVQCTQVVEADAWMVVAGLCVGQDLSERVSQMAGPVPQFSLGKSYPNFAPTGPWLVTPDELPNPDDIGLGCALNGEDMQRDSTRSMIFSVSALISRLSRTVTLYPGDLIFTGTPKGWVSTKRPLGSSCPTTN
jgi:2-keto-4-pentenoate hydratase/2-oxohepta-3-ene-1,7-dioic acid hydratase in catechol pathway